MTSLSATQVRYVLFATINLFLLLSGTHAQTPLPVAVENGRIAFASDRDGDFEIYTINDDGSDLQQLTFNSYADTDPNWSPDGSQIVYSVSNRTTRMLRIMSADGSNMRTIPALGHNLFHPEWSPDGTRIVFSALTEHAVNIFTIHPDGTNQTQITFSQGGVGTNAYEPTWSPDSQSIAYLIGEIRGGAPGALGFFSINIVQLRSGNTTRLPVSPAYHNIDWSPDGQEIIFTGTSLTSEVQSIRVDGTNYRTIPISVASPINPSWSPDGERIVFVTSNGINVMSMDGQEVVHLIDDPNVFDQDPHWQPIRNEAATTPPVQAPESPATADTR